MGLLRGEGARRGDEKVGAYSVCAVCFGVIWVSGVCLCLYSREGYEGWGTARASNQPASERDPAIVGRVRGVNV